jgi:putative transposase
MIPIKLKQADAQEELVLKCGEKGLSVKVLKPGSRNREYSSIRQNLYVKLFQEWGVSHADAARKLGISRAYVSIMVHG